MADTVDAPGVGTDGRLDVPGVIGEHLLMGSVLHALDESLLKHLRVSVLLDVENPRKRAEHAEIMPDPTIEAARVELDYYSGVDDEEGGLVAFRKALETANELIRRAYAERKSVFVFCTHGNNESAVVCMAYLMMVEQWSLERSYWHVLQKRPASAPRKAYVDKLRALEREVHGRVTLRSDQVGPSMIDLMRGLQGETQASVADDVDERSSQITDAGSSTLERASIMSNLSVTTGLHNGSSLRETVVIAEREGEDDDDEHPKAHDILHYSHRKHRTHDRKASCVIS